ncbi:MAG: alpha/beta fold hydrolase [Bryobacteraceae bacterium]
MDSRRSFLLKTAPLWLSPYIPSEDLSGKNSKAGQERTTRGGVSSDGVPDYWNDFPNYIAGRVNETRASRNVLLKKVTNQIEAAERASVVRNKVWELIGGRPETTPLNVQNTGTIERQTYKIEKIVFESQTQFYVPAHFYLPKPIHGPVPGIIAPIGHSGNGKTYISYQTLFQNLARKGFGVLTWDPPGQGERLQYIDPANGRSRYGPTGEHDRFGWPALLIGSTATQFETWDAVRALDYLLSRPEIDSSRIGCCGHSGGGTQTMYLCALEPRIKAAIVVEGNTENLAGPDYQPPGATADAEQNIIASLRLGLDRGDLLASFAPKPLLICYTPVDAGTTYSPRYVEATQEIFQQSKAIYSLYDASEKIALNSSPLPHDYDFFHRRATYEWFGRWLKNGQVDNVEGAFEAASNSVLNCTSTGQVLTSLGGRPAFQVNFDRLRCIRRDPDSGEAGRIRIQRRLRELLNFPNEPAPEHGTVVTRNTRGSLIIEQIEYHSEPNIRIPGYFLKPSGGSKFPVLVILQDEGKNELFSEASVVYELAGKSIAICSLDLRTTGITSPRLPSAGPLFYSSDVDLGYTLVSLALGSPIIAQQTWDFLRCLDYLEGRQDIDHTRIAALGSGRSGLVSLLGAALDKRVHSLFLNRTLSDFQSIVGSEEYNLDLSSFVFGILQHFDLPQICSAIAPRPGWLVNSVGAQGNGIPLDELRTQYEPAIKAYSDLGEADQLVFRVESEPIDEILLAWTQKVLL